MITRAFFVFFAVFLFVLDGVASPVLDCDIEDPYLMKGRLYYGHSKDIKGSASFRDIGFVQHCDLKYEGKLYRDIVLFYDVVDDELIVHNPLIGKDMVLVKQSVDSFKIGNYNFKRIDLSAGLSSEFFQIFAGNDSLLLLGKVVKKLQVFSDEYPYRNKRFVEETEYYVSIKHQNSNLIRIKTLGDLEKAFNEGWPQLNEWFKHNSFENTKLSEEIIEQLIKYINEKTN